MTPYFSYYLNLVRFLAAIIVLLSHYAYPHFTDGDYLIIRELNLGSDAVVLFFVLSGLVIAYSAEQKDKNINTYFFNRFTRLYSVAVPAVILTYILDQIGSSFDPDAYYGFWYNPLSFGEMLFTGLTFSGEWGIAAERLGTNGPYWSLSYEFMYYLMFGFFVFTKGAMRIFALILAVFLAGPRVLLLMPIWVMGCWVYSKIRSGIDLDRKTRSLLIFGPLVVYALSLAYGVPEKLITITHNLLGQSFTNVVLRFSNEFLWNNFIGILIALHFVGMASIKKEVPSWKDTVTWLSGATFSIYLVHYPVLQLVDELINDTPPSIYRDVFLLFSSLAVCFIFAQLFERPLGRFRRMLKNIRMQPLKQDHRKSVLDQ